MIKVKRINGTPLVINAELIETVQATPDTTITLTTGRVLVVSDSVDTVIAGVIAYRQETMGRRLVADQK